MRNLNVRVLGVTIAIAMAACSSSNTSSNTGGSGATSAGAAAMSNAGTSGGALSCSAYCSELASHCTGTNQQYASTDSCMAVCATFALGTTADTMGATLGCHFYHGGAPAMSDPVTHCPHAGPLGGGQCGTDCDNFCSEAMAVCGTQATPPYANAAACMTACAAFKPTSMVPYNATVMSGDSLACRMYHLTAASAAGGATTHCPHIGAMSAVCN